MKLTKVIFNRRLLFFTTFLIFISFVLSSITVSAHSPSNMNLSYNITTKELQVNITHPVTDPTTHYVDNITVKINGEPYLTQDYSGQLGNSFTYTYTKIEAVEGDTFEVTAECNQGGSITRQLTVSSEEVSETGEDSSTPGFELLLIIISVIVLVIIFRKKR